MRGASTWDPISIFIVAAMLACSLAGCAAQIPETAGTDIDSLAVKLAKAAEKLVDPDVVYDAAYFKIPYPNGDIPENKGVCSDLVIRAYRLIGIDLQKEVHEDISGDFNAYPNIWGMSRPDKNIDHRRVPNLMVYFRKKGLELKISSSAKDYIPGDIVCWSIPGNLPHIGIISTRPSAGGRYFVAHNIGQGQVLEDMLFDYKIIGHFRYPKTKL